MHFRLFACCLLVHGAKRSLITDVQRGTFFLIPNSLYEILTKEKERSLSEILQKNSPENRVTIEEYFDFLSDNELIFWCSSEEFSLFPDIQLHYENPARITNAIIDLNEQSTHDFGLIFKQLEELGCQNVQIRSYTERSLSYFEELLTQTENSLILSIELILKVTPEIDYSHLQSLWDNHSRLHYIIVHSVTQSTLDLPSTANIVFTSQSITSESHCGQVSSAYFNMHLNTFIESQQHNTCLNRKIAIDATGAIKNCPSLTKTYGQIGQTTLAEALNNPSFTDVWFIHKDQISICRDCEFRHICTDCRAYIQDANDIYSKPAKCSYDPYTMTWGSDNFTASPLYGR